MTDLKKKSSSLMKSEFHSLNKNREVVIVSPA
jgi:hypothetical protein